MATENTGDRVVPLDKMSDFQVAEGDPDVRGWDVIASDGRRIGEVDNLLVDTQALKVRYLEVDVDNDLLADDRDRHVLIPVGHARLNRDDRLVTVDVIESRAISTLPEYTREPLTREYETSVRRGFDQEPLAATGKDFYDDPLYDDRRFYGTGPGNPLA